MFQTLSSVKWKIKRGEEVSKNSLGACLHVMLDFIFQPQWPPWALFSVWGQIFLHLRAMFDLQWVLVQWTHVCFLVSSPGETSGCDTLSPVTLRRVLARSRVSQTCTGISRHEGFMKYRALYLSRFGRTQLWASSRIPKDASVTGPWITSWEQVNLKPKVSSQNTEFA